MLQGFSAIKTHFMYKFLSYKFFSTCAVLLLLSSCQNKAAKTDPEVSTILQHKYWVSKPFNDALMAVNILDTLGSVPCSELVFINEDSLYFTACLSDAGIGIVKTTGANTIEIKLEGFEEPIAASFDEKTSILSLDLPKDSYLPREFVVHDDVKPSMADSDGVINLARQRLAGMYSPLPEKGMMKAAMMLELREDGTQVGLGEYDLFEPWPSGIGSGAIVDRKNLLYLVKNGDNTEQVALAWQVRGDTLRLWETKNLSPEEVPEYQITKLKGTYIKQ
jgi:hypothetical protein